MKVMMVSSMEQKCGVAEYTRALNKELDEFVSVQPLSMPTMKNRKDIGALANQINQGDVAHIQYDSDHCGFWRQPFRIHNFNYFLKSIRIPCIVTVHDLIHHLPFKKMMGINLKTLLYNIVAAPVINWTSYGAFLRAGFLERADHLIVHTTVSQLFLESLDFREDKISVFYPGIPEMTPDHSYSVREQLGWKERKIITVFGYVGPHKGYETVLRAMRHMPDSVSLLFAGDIRNESYGDYSQQLRKSIIAFGLQDRVAITGYLDDRKTGSLLMESDIILLPHRLTVNTDTSYSLSYAIASGHPIITSDKPFFLEIEKKYCAIKSFKCEDEKELAQTVIEVLNRSRQEEVAAEEYREEWSWKNVAKKTHQIYCDALNQRKGHEA